MASVAKPVFNPSSMANGCLISSPSIFAAKNICPYLSISVPAKPIRLSLSCYRSSSAPSRFSFRRRTQFPTPVAAVAAESEADNSLVLEEEEVEEKDGFAWESEESEGIETLEGEEEVVGEIDAIGDSAGEGEFVEPPEEAKLFVGNLNYEVDSGKLAGFFQEAGTVETAEVVYFRESGRSRGFGFVSMSTVEEAEKAVEMFNGYEFEGRQLTVNKAAPRGTRPQREPREVQPRFRIYVGNIPWDMDNAGLEQLFVEHGKVENARVVYDRESGRSRGFGFVTMATEEEMNDAIATLDGKSIGGRALRLNVAEERPRRNFF